jgi:hypothetical protein
MTIEIMAGLAFVLATWHVLSELRRPLHAPRGYVEGDVAYPTGWRKGANFRRVVLDTHDISDGGES